MNRPDPSQPDLFTPRQPGLSNQPPRAGLSEHEALAELAALLALLRAADRLPWPDAAATMAEEQRALGLARIAGVEGERLAAAILLQTERLFAAAEQAALSPRPVTGET